MKTFVINLADVVFTTQKPASISSMKPAYELTYLHKRRRKLLKS